MNQYPYEVHATIKLHQQALRQEAERDRLLAQGRSQTGRWKPVLARVGRVLIAVGTHLEAHYAAPRLSTEQAD